jgi:hypothetical protein
MTGSANGPFNKQRTAMIIPFMAARYRSNGWYPVEEELPKHLREHAVP